VLAQCEAGTNDRSEYPTIEELRTDYDRYVGQPHYFWGEVLATDGGSFTTAYYGMNFTVVGSETEVEVGDTVQVYGTIRPNRRIAARNVVRSAASGRQYMFGISAVAVVVTAAVFFCYWTADVETLSLTPRETEGSGGDDA
jgi:hypothetical protein